MSGVEKLIVVIFIAAIVGVYLLEAYLIVDFAVGALRARKKSYAIARRPALVVHLLAVIGALCFLYAYFIEPYRVEVKTVHIQTDKLSKANIRLVHISDTHCHRFSRNEKKLIEVVKAARPDVVVFTGDALLLNHPASLPVFKETMKSLDANLGKFAVRGNVDTEYMPNLDYFSGTGLTVLEQNSVKLQKDGETFYVSGLNCRYPGIFRSVLKDVPNDAFSIFLHHFPDLIEDLGDLNVDLYLAGHTHGGQVALPFYGALITLAKHGKKYEAGMYTVDDTNLYINRGLGSHIWRVRFLARPEITIFEIAPKKTSTD